MQTESKVDDDDNTIFFQGWGLFFSMDPTSKMKIGEKFFANQEYNEQKKWTEDIIGDVDKFGSKNIPGQTSFWMLINKKGLYFLGSRNDAIQKFRHFAPFNAFKDGAEALKELGEFDEGYCVQIQTIQETLLVCLKSKAMFATFFMSLKVESSKSSAQSSDTLNMEAAMTQHETEQIVDYPHLNPEGWEASSKFGQDNVNHKDSYWMLMQNWGDCSVKCGGGEKTRQLVCVKGTEGKPCIGKSIQKMPCNLQPCLPLTPRDNQVTIKPMIIKSQGASKRPCQYQPCYLKECDLELVRDDLKGFMVPPKLPARVVMNNATLSIFMSDNFGDVMWSVDIPDITIKDYTANKDNCFTIHNDRLQTSRSVCGMALSHTSIVDQVTEWRETITMFKNKCPKEFEAKRMFEKEEDPVVMSRKNAVAATAQALKNQAKITGNEEASKKVSVEFGGVKDQLVTTLNKEMKFENLVEAEEMSRQKLKKKDKKKKKKKKKEKLKEMEECLEHKNQLDAEEEKQEFMAESAKETVESLKDAVKDMIQQSRSKQNQKINLLRKIKNKSTSQDEAELTQIREKIAKDLKKAFEKGDPTPCKPEAPQADIIKVCNKYYIDQPVFYDTCQKPDAFCTYCCVGCFGTMFPKDKNKCLDGCLKAAVQSSTSQVWDKLTADQQLVEIFI